MLGGVSAKQLTDLKQNNLVAYESVFDDALFQTWLCKVCHFICFNFVLICLFSQLKLQVYENKLKCTVIGLANLKIDWECSQIESVLKITV